MSIGTLLAFALVCGGVIVLRYTRPDLPRPFRVPGYPVVPVLGVLSCGYLMYGLPRVTWERLITLDGDRPDHLLRLRVQEESPQSGPALEELSERMSFDIFEQIVQARKERHRAALGTIVRRLGSTPAKITRKC